MAMPKSIMGGNFGIIWITLYTGSIINSPLYCTLTKDLSTVWCVCGIQVP